MGVKLRNDCPYKVKLGHNNCHALSILGYGLDVDIYLKDPDKSYVPNGSEFSAIICLL